MRAVSKLLFSTQITFTNHKRAKKKCITYETEKYPMKSVEETAQTKSLTVWHTWIKKNDWNLISYANRDVEHLNSKRNSVRTIYSNDGWKSDMNHKSYAIRQKVWQLPVKALLLDVFGSNLPKFILWIEYQKYCHCQLCMLLPERSLIRWQTIKKLNTLSWMCARIYVKCNNICINSHTRFEFIVFLSFFLKMFWNHLNIFECVVWKARKKCGKKWEKNYIFQNGLISSFFYSEKAQQKVFSRLNEILCSQSALP